MAPVPEEKAKEEAPKVPSGLEIAGTAFNTVATTVSFVVSAVAFKALIERAIRAGIKTCVKWYTERKMREMNDEFKVQLAQMEEELKAKNMTWEDVDWNTGSLARRDVKWEAIHQGVILPID